MADLRTEQHEVFVRGFVVDNITRISPIREITTTDWMMSRLCCVLAAGLLHENKFFPRGPWQCCFLRKECEVVLRQHSRNKVGRCLPSELFL